MVVWCLGTQIVSKSWISLSSCRSIPTSRIGDLGIYERFCGFGAGFCYLAVVVRSEEGLVVAFPVGFPLSELGRRYSGGACMNRIALVSEVEVAVEGAPDYCLRARCPSDM